MLSGGVSVSTSVVSAVRVPHYINGKWVESNSTEWQSVINPATGESVATVPLADGAEVAAAVEAAAAAFPAWRRTPPEDRIQPLFRLKYLLEEHTDELSRIITTENGKTFAETKAELRRAIENVEVACGIPMMMQGYNLEDVARGEIMIRQPLGVVAAITPSNFPGMISFWFLPYAIATGNTLVMKPSERVPLTMKRAFELLEQTGLPAGVVNMVNGEREAVDALVDHPKVRAISFIGLTPVARTVYARARTASGRSAKAGRRTTSSCFRTRTCAWPRRSSATAPSAALGSGALPSRSQSRWVRRKRRFAMRLPNPRPGCASATDWMRACRWGR